jgi:hypothetical protein
MSGQPRIRAAGFGAGLRWLPAGAELLFSGLGPLAGIASLWLLVSLVAVVIPVIGQLFLVLFTPLFTAGVLIAFDQVRQQKAPAPFTLFAAWKDLRKRSGLLLIGAWSIFGSMLAATILVAWMGSQLSESELEAAMTSPEALAQALTGVSIGGGLLIALAVFSLVLAAIYFSIPLIAFGNWPAVSALLTSVKALVINWAAFIGFVLVFFAVAAATGLILVLMVTVTSLALGQFGVIVGQVLFLVATMFIQMLMAGAQYVAFCQVFGWTPETDNGEGTEPEDHLVA